MNDEAAKLGARRLQQVEKVFHAVLAVPFPQRDGALYKRCAGDAELLAEVRSLLTASDAEQRLARRLAAEARVATDSAAHGRSIGPYRLQRLLGRGGMGAVYLAHRADGQFDQQVAVKVIDLPQATDLFRERFRTERQILAGLVHPYIARLQDGGVSESGELYLAMEYVDGVSITRHVEDRQLPMRQRLALFGKVCEAVLFAHQCLVVHRDLKPDNILIAADGTPRLLDFGTAKLLVPHTSDSDTGFTRYGLNPFTPQFASPEQVLGEPISTASDTYSLGVLLYVLITDVQPYAMAEFTTSEMLRVICSEQPLKPSAAAGRAGRKGWHIDQDLDAIVLKAMRKEPQHRYQTVEQFLADVHAWLNGRPVMARRGTLQYRAGKFIRRHKLPLAAAALFGISILVGIGGILWQARVTNLQRARAEARSADLRQLSNSLLSEIDEAIKNLPGSTPVQRMLVERVLDHLDRMSKDAAGDKSTLADLANAYTRLGNIQGNPYDQNIGDVPGALISLDKAIAIAADLHGTAPADDGFLAALALAQQSRSEVLFGVGRTEEAVATMRLARDAFIARAAAPGATALTLTEAASAAGALGDQLGQTGTASLGDSAAALAAFRQALDFAQRSLKADPDFARAQRGVAVNHLKIGNLLLETDPAKAIGEYRQSLSAWQVMRSEEKDAVGYKRGIAGTYMKLALAQNDVGDYAAAFEAFDQAQHSYDYIASLDATDARAQYDVVVFHANKGQAYLDRVDPVINPGMQDQRERNARLAISQLQQASDLLERLVKVDPTNTVWLGNLANQKIIIGSLSYRLAATDAAAQASASSLSLLRKAAEDPAASINTLDLATSSMLFVAPARLRDAPAMLHYAERLAVLTKRKKPNTLLQLAQSYRFNGSLDKAAATAAEALAQLAVPQPGSAPPRLYKLLRAEMAAR